MKYSLKFEIDDEQGGLDIIYPHIHGPKVVSVVWDLSQKLRSMYKYEEHTEEELAIIQQIRTELWELLEHHGCTWVME